MHTGNLLTQLLADYGIKAVFGVAGGQTVALFDGIEEHGGLHHIVCRDERNVAYMADAYARLTGTIGVCDVTVGPGTTKLPSGLMEAHYSSYPILCLISELFLDWRHLYDRGAALQAMDQEQLIRQFCKWTATITDPGQLPVFLATALRRANSGRPGPVSLVLPQEVFDQQLPAPSQSARSDASLASFPISRSSPDGAATARAAVLLGNADRPVIVGGGGIHISGAYDELKALAERLGAAVATTFSGRGVLEDDHELAVGLLGNIGTSAAKSAVEQADVVLLVGFKSGQNSTFTWTLPRADQTVIHLDIDATEIGKVVSTEVALVGDAKLGLADLATALPTVPADHNARIGQTRTLCETWRQQIAADLKSDAVPIKPQRVIHELNQLSNPDDILCCDASYVSGWGTMFYHVCRHGKTILAPRGSAGLGFGIPAAIGAAVARPRQRCIAICGDHGVSYSLGELATAVHYKLNITVIVFNNQGSRWIDHYHQVFFAGSGKPFVWGDTDFATVGQGFGCLGIRVTQPEHLAGALRRALDHSGPAIVDIQTSGDETPIQAYRESMSTQREVIGTKPLWK
jgi:acetolactate synthase-1/2/3 large subunit